MKEPKVIITVSGEDKVGIVAEFSKILAQCNVNIEDIKQTIMQEHFVMFLMGDISNADLSFQEIKDKLQQTGKDLGMEVWVQRKAIFDKMHTI